MMKQPLLTTAFLAMLGAACLPASAQTFTCPERYPMSVLQFGPASDGWTASAGDLAAPLESMGLFSGPPSHGAMLKPNSATGAQVTWLLEPPYDGGLWIQCAYGRNALTLAKPLGSLPKRCTAKYGKERPYQPRPIEFSCQ